MSYFEKSPQRQWSIDDYELQQIIGQGGFAHVFSASVRRSVSRFVLSDSTCSEDGMDRDSNDNPNCGRQNGADDDSYSISDQRPRQQQQVAIKRMDKSKIHKQKLMSRVENEIRIHRQCKHPGIIECYDSFEDANFIYMVLQYSPQCNLYQLLRSHMNNNSNGDDINSNSKYGFPLDLVSAVVSPLVSAVSYLHSHSILHRDLKLSNVLVEYRYVDDKRSSPSPTATPAVAPAVDGFNQQQEQHLMTITNVYLCDFGLATQVRFMHSRKTDRLTVVVGNNW